MFNIKCPHCGPRDENEFIWRGPAFLTRPVYAEDLSDESWADYLYMRENKKGKNTEQWCHSKGCGEWFVIERDTETHEIYNTSGDNND